MLIIRPSVWFQGCLGMVLLAAGAVDAREHAELPWSLRDHYTFSFSDTHVDYDEHNATWRIRQGAGAVVMDAVGFSAVLGPQKDREILSQDLPLGEATREPFSGPFGEGTAYSVEFPVQDGLRFRHRLVRFSGRPFSLIELQMQNAGDAPVTVHKLATAVFGPASMAGWPEGGRAAARHLYARGGIPVVSRDAPAMLTVFVGAERGANAAFGVMPDGQGSSGATFYAAGKGWQGEVATVFEPPRVLRPGETLRGDSMWLAYGHDDAASLELNYGWAFAELHGDESRPEAVPGWVTVSDDASLTALLRLAAKAAPLGIRHALIPPMWEGRPGSMEGAAPRYPRKMARAAAALREVDATAGITIDPLLAEEGQAPWAARSEDGRTWLDPRTGEGAARIREQVRTLLDWGFDFIVVQPTEMPDAVLAHFGLTRATADYGAMGAVRAAADRHPVFPSAAGALNPKCGAWLEAAAAVAFIARYDLPIGPAELKVDTDGPWEAGAETALRLWPGPIQLTSLPGSKASDALRRAVAGSRVYAVPIEAAAAPPRVWQVLRGAGPSAHATVAAFAGAPAWEADWLQAPPEKPRLVWRADTGAILEENRAPASGKTRFFGVCAQPRHPVLLGAAGGLMLGVPGPDVITWSAEERTLSGAVSAPPDIRNAYVYVPAGWRLEKGTVGGKRLRGAAPQKGVLPFAIDGESSRFEFVFERQ